MQEFDEWNKVKKDIENSNPLWTIKVREIYWLKIGQNIGYEVYGKGDVFLRPVLIFRKFSKDSFLGIPLTSRLKNDMFHFEFMPIKGKKMNNALLSQIRIFSSKRIHDKMGKISVDDFNELKEKLRELMQM